MPLIELQNGPSQWFDIKDAAHILWRASTIPDLGQLRNILANDISFPSLSAKDLHTGINASRRAVVVCHHEKITIAFEGSDPNELITNMWINGKGPNWWDLPYPVYTDGNQVHSFYRDMWHGMRATTFEALSKVVDEIAAKGCVPRSLVITGYSMGGGVSIMAFMDIVEHIRKTYGTQSPSPQGWADDSNLGSLLQHLTFAAVADGDQGYYTVLNKVYESFGIRAWDFMNHQDVTRHMHHFAFRSWRGHRYILPDAVVRHCGGEFGPQNHSILGYMRAAEWMRGNGTDQVKSEYGFY